MAVTVATMPFQSTYIAMQFRRDKASAMAAVQIRDYDYTLIIKQLTARRRCILPMR